MFPSVVPKFTRNPKKFRAEKEIFHLLRDDPGTRAWTVIHSVLLRERDKGDVGVHGEIDFVVIVPGEGIVCLEVKGGGFTRSGNLWYRPGDEKPLRESPFEQAVASMHGFVKLLEQKFGGGVCPVDCMLVFPDIDAPPVEMGLASCAVIGKNHLQRDGRLAMSRCFKRFASEVLRKRQKRNHRLPSPGQAERIAAYLCGDFRGIVSVGAALRHMEEKVVSLTEEQYERLDSLEANARCLVHGGAGTGKTMLALEYARRAEGDGARVLFLCANRHLADWLREQTDGMTCNADTWYGFAGQVIEGGGLAEEFRAARWTADNETLFSILYPDFAMRVLQQGVRTPGLETLFDLLILDEAQDLLALPRMLEFLDQTLCGGLAGGRWAIFGDFQRQALYQSEPLDPKRVLSNYCEPDRMTVEGLRYNCRNSLRIAQAAMVLAGFDQEQMCFRTGAEAGHPVEHQFYASDTDLVTSVTALLDRLVRDGVALQDIVMLSPHRLRRSGLWEGRAASSYQFQEVGGTPDSASESDKPAVKFCTIQTFKGLESSVVIMVDLTEKMDNWDDRQSLLYVGLSRARTLLLLMIHENARQSFGPLLKKLPQ